jgi:hypothetical protein
VFLVRYGLNLYSIYRKADHSKNRRGLNLAMLKLLTVHVTKLPLYHMTCKIGMICSAKPILTENLCIVQKEEFSVTCYMSNTHS